VTAPTAAWSIADTAIALMTLLNLAVLLAMRGEVKEETRRLPLGENNRL
jgi:Na+/alanine symporter